MIWGRKEGEDCCRCSKFHGSERGAYLHHAFNHQDRQDLKVGVHAVLFVQVGSTRAMTAIYDCVGGE